MREINIKIETIRSGQLHKYGHSEYEYKIEVDGMFEHEVKSYCTHVLERCSQTINEWNREDADSYFEGYYEFERLSQNDDVARQSATYRYFVHKPSTH